MLRRGVAVSASWSIPVSISVSASVSISVSVSVSAGRHQCITYAWGSFLVAVLLYAFFICVCRELCIAQSARLPANAAFYVHPRVCACIRARY